MGDFPGLPGLPVFNPPGPGFLPNDPCGMFPDLPGCPTGGGGGGGGVGKIPGYPPIALPGPGGTTTTKVPGGTVTVKSNVPSFWSDPLGYFGATIQASGLRILFFVLGIILVIMGLYFLKETRSVVTVPINIAKKGVKTIAEAAATG